MCEIIYFFNIFPKRQKCIQFAHKQLRSKKENGTKIVLFSHFKCFNMTVYHSLETIEMLEYRIFNTTEIFQTTSVTYRSEFQ